MRSKSPSFDLRRHSGLGSETKACNDKDLDEAIAIRQRFPAFRAGQRSLRRAARSRAANQEQTVSHGSLNVRALRSRVSPQLELDLSGGAAGGAREWFAATPDGSVHFDNPYRHEYGCILASLIRVVRDITLAEDALQDGSFSLAT